VYRPCRTGMCHRLSTLWFLHSGRQPRGVPQSTDIAAEWVRHLRTPFSLQSIHPKPSGRPSACDPPESHVRNPLLRCRRVPSSLQTSLPGWNANQSRAPERSNRPNQRLFCGCDTTSRSLKLARCSTHDSGKACTLLQRSFCQAAVLRIDATRRRRSPRSIPQHTKRAATAVGVPVTCGHTSDA
jgi:hypothetical protein